MSTTASTGLPVDDPISNALSSVGKIAVRKVVAMNEVVVVGCIGSSIEDGLHMLSAPASEESSLSVTPPKKAVRSVGLAANPPTKTLEIPLGLRAIPRAGRAPASRGYQHAESCSRPSISPCCGCALSARWKRSVFPLHIHDVQWPGGRAAVGDLGFPRARRKRPTGQRESRRDRLTMAQDRAGRSRNHAHLDPQSSLTFSAAPEKKA